MRKCSLQVKVFKYQPVLDLKCTRVIDSILMTVFRAILDIELFILNLPNFPLNFRKRNN